MCRSAGIAGHFLVAAILGVLGTDADARLRCSSSAPKALRVSPGETVVLAEAGARSALIVEESGGEFTVQSGDNGAFIEIVIRPPRLGIIAIPAGTEAVRARLRSGDAPSELRVYEGCEDARTLEFLAMLQQRFVDGIEAGAAAAAATLNDIERDLASERDAWRRAWLLHARANALLSAGLHARAPEAFGEAREAWLAIGDSTRAAVALLAAAEDLSRSGRFDDAERAFQQAESELTASGAQYYALRARAALCLIVSRRGRPAEAVVCEEAVAEAFEQRGDLVEAGARGISIANQWMKLGGDDASHEPRKDALAKARARLLRVDAIASTLSPIARAKLHAAFGTLHLQAGDLHAAVQELKAASDQYGTLGLPRDQATLDLKLAAVAQQAGAFDEELRLLERAVTHLDPAGAPDKLATASLRIAENRLARGELDQARRQIELATALCARLGMKDCIERATLLRAEHELAAGRAEHAREIALAMPTPALSTTVFRRALVLASADLALGEPASALRRIEPMLTPDLLRSDIDQFVFATLTRADAEVAMGARNAARATLHAGMNALRAAMLTWPSAALRASGRHRSNLLMAAYFDLVQSEDRATLLQASDDLRSVLDVMHPLRLLTGATPPSLSTELRDQLAAAIVDDQPVDRREVFLGMSSPLVANASPTAVSPKVIPVSRPTSGAATSTDAEALLLPLAGRTRFQLLAATDQGVNRCIDMPKQDYIALANRFSASLLGEDEDVRALNQFAEEWFDAIIACGVSPSVDWRVLTLADGPNLPWSWIAATAEARGLPEPAVIHSFSTAHEAEGSHVVLSQATILNLDPGRGDGLPHAAAEHDRVAEYLASTGLYTITRAGLSLDPDAVLDALRPPGHLVHIIGHGSESTFGALYSGLWLPGPDRPRLLAFPDVAAANLGAELVVLSACGDLRSDASASGSRLRLVEALLGAGVRNVIAWSGPASDSAAALWSTRLYEELRSGSSPGHAARASSSALRKTAHFRHPRFWAGVEYYDRGRP